MDKSDNRFLMFIPSLMVFLLALSLTPRYQWPFGWDIFYHIHLAKIYMSHGLTLHDPLYNAPKANIINYPPIFHITVLFSIFNF